jgi:cytochrome P450
VARGDELVVLLTSPRFNFGAGRHACPGQHVASAIVSAICG